MRGAIVTDDARAVDAQHDVQVLQRHVMHDIVIGPLEEGGVDIAVGQHAGFGETGAERHRMPFGDTHVIDAFRQLFLHDAHAASAGHRRSDAYYPLVRFRHLQQRLAEHLLP